MSSALTVRFQRFPYLVIGWALLAGLSLVAPDGLLLTHQEGLWIGVSGELLRWLGSNAT